MKRLIVFLMLITIWGMSCKKEPTDEIIDEEQVLQESNLAFINADWTFDATGDTLKDRIIGLWLSYEVSYQDVVCDHCDSLFTWVIESTGTMVKRNNAWGDHETMYGNWEIDSANESVCFSYKFYASGGTPDDYMIITDTISIEKLSENLLWTSQFIDYPPTTKLSIKFNRLK